MATGKGYKKRERERLRALSRRSKDEEDDGGRSRDTRQEEGMRFIRLWALQLSVINVSIVARMPLWSNDGGWFLSATMEGGFALFTDYEGCVRDRIVSPVNYF